MMNERHVMHDGVLRICWILIWKERYECACFKMHSGKWVAESIDSSFVTCGCGGL
jgi:hypothetical protein